jgi:hypothetical protein
MPYEQKPGTSFLWRNRKKTSERSPDFTGDISIEIEGKLYQLEAALWEKQGQNAGLYFGLSLKLKQGPPFRQTFREAPAPGARSGRDRFNQRVQQMGSDLDAVFGKPKNSDDDIPL